MVAAAATGAAASGAGESGPDGDGAAAARAEGDVAGGGTFHLLGVLSTHGFTYTLAELADELNKRSNGIIPLLSGDDVESAINQATGHVRVDYKSAGHSYAYQINPARNQTAVGYSAPRLRPGVC
ncbi:hypothetical protein M885DRAFT_561400 [Pelagophyceae sp. CCMP2097]|nr:hypothetical protein M885DRAFT_561400 [Pelagophyceae sp. CCMP2097]